MVSVSAPCVYGQKISVGPAELELLNALNKIKVIQPSELKGKKIKFIDQDYSDIIFVTSGNEVCMVGTEYGYYDDKSLTQKTPFIDGSDYLNLGFAVECGFVTQKIVDEYNREVNKKYQQEALNRDYTAFLKLKAKFENQKE